MAEGGLAPHGQVPREIELLLFHSAGVNMAVETSQVDGIISSEQAAQRAIIFGALSGLLGMGGTASPASSKVLIFRDGDETYGIGIDELESIMPANLDAIQPLPDLLSSVAALRPFWGVIPRGNGVVLLIDFFRLKSLISRCLEITA